ncbi:MAG TPA: ABC transporter permease [bacterium]|jgi:putative ABC transport system permease protein|nr:ABC transporter permease [bacterium]
MKLLEILEESILVLKTNRMRTVLSVLGIIIGIGSVISLITLGEASQQSVKERIQSLGSNLITISPGGTQSGFLRGGPDDAKTLKYNDALEIEKSDRLTTVDKVAASYSSRAQISFQENNMNTNVIGITENYFSLRNIEIEYGVGITQKDIGTSSKVVVIGNGVIEELFTGKVNPIGQGIRIDGNSFKIIGITKSKGSEMVSSDDSVFIPLTTAQKVLYGIDHVTSILVSAKNEELIDPAMNQLGYLLLELHGIKNPEDADFSITSQEDLLETVSEITGTFTTLLTGIAAISLVVGGIGIMNIMLVTVTERTREIGIRKALGAKRKTITTQFLVESIVLTLTGGVLGVLLGIGVSLIITKTMGLPSVISITSISLAVGVSCLIGIIFGWYPAHRASKLQPIEALRYE